LNLVDVAPKPYADLVVSSVTAPTTGGSGRPIQLSWTVLNDPARATGVTDTSAWNDFVSLATDSTGTHIAVQLLGSVEHVRALAPGGSYLHTVTAELPDDLPPGTYYAVVHTLGPYEFIYNQNNTGVSGPVTVTATPAPDLTPTQIVAPTTAQA